MEASATIVQRYGTSPRIERLCAILARHRLVVAILILGGVVRVFCEIAYHPAQFFPDSWEYLHLALTRPFVGFQVDRPSGYPLLVWLFTLGGQRLILLTVAQHLAGMATAVVVYVIGLRMHLGRWLAAAVAALVALGGDWIALEQFVMADPFFSLCLVTALLLAIESHRRPRLLVVSGALLGAAVLMRVSGVYAVPPWLAFLALRRVGLRRFAGALGALLVPLLAYSALHAADGRGFGITQSSGWFLYARVAPTARCTSAWPRDQLLRRLCPTPQELAQGWEPGAYLWNPSSPPNRVYGSIYTGDVGRSSAVLATFARQAVERRPGAFVSMVATDVLSVFDPSKWGWESPVRFAAPGSYDWVDKDVRRAYLAGYHRRSAWPQSELRAYWRLIHTPRSVLGILTALGLLSVGAATLSRRWRAISMPAETVLVTGVGFLLMVGTIATSSVNMRYVLPSVPLLSLGGVCALRAVVLAAVRVCRRRIAGAVPA